jgi:hypothetical protein
MAVAAQAAAHSAGAASAMEAAGATPRAGSQGALCGKTGGAVVLVVLRQEVAQGVKRGRVQQQCVAAGEGVCVGRQGGGFSWSAAS